VYKDTKYNFLHLDFFNNKEDIIDCDLYILKDILQHWSINDITMFLDYLINHKVFKYILITNCSYQTNDNVDINTGNFRPLSADYLPLKKYNPEILYKYNTKEVSVIRYEKKCIPKVIHICYKELAPIQKYSIIWKQLNPDYELRLYDDTLCEQFLLENFSQLHCDIFKFIKDGPIKADFWRCCILYKNGGIYADADILPIVPLCEYIDESADFLTCISDKSVGGYNPHLIRCLAGEPLMKKCIETYIEYHKTNKPYGYWEWSVVGIFNIIAKDIYPINTLDTRKYQFLHEDKQVYCLHENKIVLRNRYPFYKNHRFIN
jgi:mannosyltransferase OCH1-like enzyme